MSNWGYPWVICLEVAAQLMLAAGQARGADEPASPSARWKEAIAKFEAEDARTAPVRHGVLFVGSSSIRMWNVAESFPRWKELLINRGFGGSQIADVNYFFDRIVAPYEPRVIVFYSGDNDVASGKSPEAVAADFRVFVERVRSMSPATHIILLPIKPSLKRWELWPRMRQANQEMRELLAKDPASHYVDTPSAMLGEDGRPQADLFLKDGLHLNAKGYALWARLVEPILEEVLRPAVSGSREP